MQGRPIVSGVTVGAAPRVAFLGSQDGSVHAVHGIAGAPGRRALWTSGLLATEVQASPAGLFTTFGGLYDLVLVGTRRSTPPNSFFALKLAGWDDGVGVHEQRGAGRQRTADRDRLRTGDGPVRQSSAGLLREPDGDEPEARSGA